MYWWNRYIWNNTITTIGGDNMVKTTYDWKVGVKKTVKNFLIMFAPAWLAFLAGVPEQYAPIASAVAYYYKNWYEINKQKKY